MPSTSSTVAARTHVFTLFAEPAQLLARRSPKGKPGPRGKLALLVHESLPRVATMERLWLAFLDARRLEGVLVETTDAPRVIARADLEARRAAMEGAGPG